jgi:RND family efflux transporter MFP subunit
MNYVPEEHALRVGEQAKAGGNRHRQLARALAIGTIAVLVLLVAFGTFSHYRRAAAAAAVLEARNTLVPAVRTLVVQEDLQPRTIDLPGSMAAFDSATLYARATGYISVRNVDIGSKVHKGDVLAVIAAPDLDQQLVQTKAQLLQLEAAVRQAQANADLGRVTNQRTSRLVAQGWSSAQQGDNDRLTFDARTAAVAVAEANVVAQQAAVHRLEQLTDFEKITAPFDGEITGRFIDVGSLVTADAASGSPLLRVQVFVPQTAYFGVRQGDHATVTVPEIVNRTFDGTVARNARALATGTRTLLTEVDVDNKSGELAAGLYSVIRLQLRRLNPVVRVPSQAVIFDKDGLSVAVVEDGKAQFRKLELDADNGADVEVRAGLLPGDRVILSPPVNLTNGMQVETL